MQAEIQTNNMEKISIIFLLVILFFLSSPVFSQKSLILANGKTLSFRKFAKPPGRETINVIDTNKEKIKFPINEVIGYYDDDSQSVYYRKASTDSSGSNYEFVERKLEGRIQLYSRLEQSAGHFIGGSGGMYTGGSSNTHLYLEKNGVYKHIFTTNAGFRKSIEKKEILRSFVNDYTESVKVMEDPHFNLTYDNIFKVVREYNIRAFTTAGKKNPEGSYNVAFYSRIRSKSEEHLILRVNDSIEYDLPNGHPRIVNLPSDFLSKICFISDTGSLCDLISASPFTMKYFELKYVANSNSFDIEKKTATEAQKYILFFNQNR